MNWTTQVDAYRHVTPTQLKTIMPRCPDSVAWARAFDDALDRFPVDNIAMLLAQVGHESADLTRLRENLNYSAKRLTEVWPSRFPTLESTRSYAHNAVALANNVYANRMGNGPPESGDGYLFAGNGPMQLTGRDNHERFAAAIGSREPVVNPESLTKPTLGALSACWFYSVHVPSGADIELATRRINGGTHGLADRKTRYDRARLFLTHRAN